MLRTGRNRGTSTADPIEIPESGAVELSFSVALLSHSQSAEYAGVSLRSETVDLDVVSLLGGPDEPRILGLNDTDLGSFGLDQWTRLRVVFKRTGAAVDCTYFVDGDRRGRTTIDPELFGSAVDLELLPGGPAVLWDDFSVVHGADAAALDRSGGLLGATPLFQWLFRAVGWIVALGVVLLLLAGVASGVDGESNGNAKPKSRTNRSNTSSESGTRARSDDEVEFDEYGQIKE